MQSLLELSNNKGYSVYFFGAKEEVLQDMLDPVIGRTKEIQ